MSDRGAVEAPSLYHYLAEPYRAVAGHMAFVGAIPALGMAHAGEGHGRHVLVIPGLMSDDLSTRLMRKTIDLAGYRSHGWRLGRNIGPTRTAIEGVVTRLEDLATRQHGPIPVIGWSLGGLFARGLATLRPQLVDRVITMGSPIKHLPHTRWTSGPPTTQTRSSRPLRYFRSRTASCTGRPPACTTDHAPKTSRSTDPISGSAPTPPSSTSSSTGSQCQCTTGSPSAPNPLSHTCFRIPTQSSSDSRRDCRHRAYRPNHVCDGSRSACIRAYSWRTNSAELWSPSASCSSASTAHAVSWYGSSCTERCAMTSACSNSPRLR